MRRNAAASVLIALLLATTAISYATTVARFSFDNLCVGAATIAVVRCEAADPMRDTATGHIVTQSRLKVLRSVKGSPGSEIVLTLPGGRLGDARTMIPGIPEFVPGRETVVFLTAAEAGGSAWPVGLGQGCYGVVADANGARSVVLQAGVTPLPRGALYKPGSRKPFRVPLETFLQDVGRAFTPPPGVE